MGTYTGTGFAKYQVSNQKPYPPTPSDGNGVSWNHCTGFQATSLPTFHWNYSDPEGDPQQSYQIQIDDDKPETPPFTDSGDSSSPSYTPPTTPWKTWMHWNTDYWWQVKVKDDKGNWSDWSTSTLFASPSHAAPWPDFSPSKERISQNEVITFYDNSQCYLSGDTALPCRDLDVTYEWDFDYIEPDFTIDKTTKGNTTWSYTLLGAHKVKLRITDNLATCYSETETVTVTLPLPRWWEIPPF